MSAILATLLNREPRSTEPDAVNARHWLETHGFPTTRDEAWRYSPLPAILQALDIARPGPRISRDHHDPSLAPARIDQTTRIAVLDGHFAPEHSDTAPPGVWIAPRSRTPTDLLPAPTAENTDLINAFHALNASAADTILITVAPGAAPDQPIHLAHAVTPNGTGHLVQPRIVVLVGEDARVDLVETYDSARDAVATTNASTEIHLGKGASLTHHRLQADHPAAIHLAVTSADLGDASHYRSTSVGVGAAIARHTVAATLSGADARCELSGLYLPQGQQHHDTAVLMDHRALDGASRQHFLGIEDDHARGSFTGHIRIHPDTAGNLAHQANHNLVLSPTARSDSRPWLEILADDVACTHGATVGRLDEDALFYLRSRGIPPQSARQLLIDAFASEIVDSIEPLAVREHVQAQIERHRSRRASS